MSAKSISNTPARATHRERGQALEPDNLRRTLDIMRALMRDEGVTLDEMVEITGWTVATVHDYLGEIEKGWKTAHGMPMLVEHLRDGRSIYRLQ